jgi:hypothetical protein
MDTHAGAQLMHWRVARGDWFINVLDLQPPEDERSLIAESRLVPECIRLVAVKYMQVVGVIDMGKGQDKIYNYHPHNQHVLD